MIRNFDQCVLKILFYIRKNPYLILLLNNVCHLAIHKKIARKATLSVFYKEHSLYMFLNSICLICAIFKTANDPMKGYKPQYFAVT